MSKKVTDCKLHFVFNFGRIYCTSNNTIQTNVKIWFLVKMYQKVFENIFVTLPI